MKTPSFVSNDIFYTDIVSGEVKKFFPQLAKQTYLNSCSLGALSQPVEAALAFYLNSWKIGGSRSWYAENGWLETIESVRALIANLIGAYTHEIALFPNVSSALGVIAHAINYKDRPNVITSHLDFPTLVYQWQAKKTIGVNCHILESIDDIQTPLTYFERVIDNKTALIATSRVYFTSGAIQEVGELTELAHRHGALLLLDDYQGVGQIPIDVHDLKVDVLVGGTQKWLLGGPGCAFMYVREALQEKLQSTVVGWFGHNRQLDFIVSSFEPRNNARRFELGTPSIGAMYAAEAGLNMISAIGVDWIRQQNQILVEDLVNRLLEKGAQLKIHGDKNKRSAIVMIRAEEAEDKVIRLAKQNIFVDTRPGFIRVSPHFYNSIQDNQIFVEGLFSL